MRLSPSSSSWCFMSTPATASLLQMHQGGSILTRCPVTSSQSNLSCLGEPAGKALQTLCLGSVHSLLFSFWGLEVHVAGQGGRDGRDAVSLSLHPLSFPFSRNGNPTPACLPGKTHGQGSQVAFSSRVAHSWTFRD